MLINQYLYAIITFTCLLKKVNKTSCLQPGILLIYSVFKLFIWFANAALMGWKLTASSVINIAPVTLNIHQAILV